MNSTSVEFCDTNVLVYAHDVTAGDKQQRARALLRRLWEIEVGAVSIQVLQELFVNLTRKLPSPLPVAAKLLWPLPDRGLRRRIHRLTSPTLILWGEQDRLMPPAYGEAFRDKIRGARLQLIPGAGHLADLEQPEAVATAILEFLEKADATR